MAMHVFNMLREAARLGASDVHLISNSVPMVRVGGQLVPFPDMPPLTPDQCGTLIHQMLNDTQRQRFEKEWSLDYSLSLDGVRYRGNVFIQRHGLEAVLRIIPSKIPSPEDIELPSVILQLTDLLRGLVLVTGPTGSGKSTTLACLINLINQKRRANIITIEDPIEFIYENRMCIISQREIGQHTPSYSSALKYVLRQDPDILLIGEMRDYETIAAALTIAETGHLVFATLHTNDAAQAVDRIIDVFPGRQQLQVRAQLAGVLRAVVAQQLVPRANARGRVAAREVMLVTPAISNLIRQAKTHEINSAIELGANSGMVSMDRALVDLLRRGQVNEAEAVMRMSNAETALTRAMR